MIESAVYGAFQGQDVTRFTLSNTTGIRVELIDWGATLTGLHVPVAGEGHRNIVLGLANFEEYPASPYFGATCGRFANRIGQGRFTLDGQEYQVDRNQNGEHTLHGGTDNFSKRIWKALPDKEANAVNFQLVSPDGDQGFPGTVMAACTYRLDDDNCLSIVMTAAATKPTPVNMVHHSYWNLDSKTDGLPTVDRHRLRLWADQFLPTGDGQIPTGSIESVEGTAFDFTDMRSLTGVAQGGVDNCFVVSRSVVAGDDVLQPVAELRSSDGSVSMQLKSNQPGVQVYNGYKLDVDGSQGHIGPRSGLCLETEAFPDAPNHEAFPSAILRPGETYHHVMEHRFSLK